MDLQKSYDQWAASYDSDRNRTRDLDKRISKEVIGADTYEKAVELGCGTGKNTQWLCEISVSVLALDLSEKMLAQARKKVTAKNVHFMQVDFQTNWPVEASSADLITCNLVLEHIRDIDLVFEHTSKALNKNGLFFVSELHPFKMYSGSRAKFETDSGKLNYLDFFVHHTSDYLSAAQKAGLNCIKLNEWFDDDRRETPRLISFVFQK